jgi:hypothetical protein
MSVTLLLRTADLLVQNVLLQGLPAEYYRNGRGREPRAWGPVRPEVRPSPRTGDIAGAHRQIAPHTGPTFMLASTFTLQKGSSFQ